MQKEYTQRVTEWCRSRAPVAGDENETASGAMVQILQVADSAIAAAGEKGTDCQKAAANIAFQAVFDAYSGGILGGFLKAIKSALTNILNLGENGLEEYLKDKLKKRKRQPKTHSRSG